MPHWTNPTIRNKIASNSIGRYCCEIFLEDRAVDKAKWIYGEFDCKPEDVETKLKEVGY